MALIMAEGFSLLEQNPTKNEDSQSSPLLKMGWELNESANTATADVFTKFNIIPDEIFPDRNVLKIGAIANSNSARGVYMRYRIPEDKVPDKLLVGLVMRLTLPSASKISFYPAFGTINMQKIKSSGGSITMPEEGLWLFTAAGMSGGVSLPCPAGTFGVVAYWDNKAGYQNFYFESGRDYHLEYLLERDTGRCRLYVDGVLITDYQYAGTLQEDLTKGFTFWQGGSSSPNGCYGQYSNIYAIAIDNEHPGPLGPATRVLEVPPKADVVAQFSRDETRYSSNADLLQNTMSDDGYLLGGDVGQHDILSLDGAKIKANAAAIHGVVAKFVVNNLDADEHDVGLTYGNGEEQVDADSHPLMPTEMTIAYRDISTDPKTGARWTPEGVASLTVGYTVNA